MNDLKGRKGEELEVLLARSSALPSLDALFDLVQRLVPVEDDDRTMMLDALGEDTRLPKSLLGLLRGQSEGLRSTRDAVSELGAITVRNLSLALGFVAKLRESGGFAREAEFLWRTSLANGFAARLLARSASSWDPEEAFLAGVVADCGSIVMYELVPGYDDLYEQFRLNGGDLIDLERAELGTDHMRVSQRLLSVWRFDDELGRLVAAHHSSDGLAAHPELRQRARVLEASWLCARALTIPAFEHEARWLPVRCAELLRCDAEQIANIASALEGELRRCAPAFGLSPA